MITKKGIERNLNELIRIGDKEQPLKDWLEEVGLTYDGYRGRRYHGLTVEEALLTPKRSRMIKYVEPKATKAEEKKTYKFVRSGGSGGTWKWV